MNSSYMNMMAGAFLGTVFVLFSISLISEGLFHSEAPEKPGYVIEAAESSSSGGQAPAKAELADISPLLASADVVKGEKVFKKCAACHTVDDGGANKVGPNLWDIVNRPLGEYAGFNYSSALVAFAAETPTWDYEALNKFLAKPKAYIKGTAMGFAGVKKEQERADLIAYLRSLAGEPAPLP